MKRYIPTSRDMETKMKLSKKTRVDIYSFFPIDKHDCACKEMIKDWKDKLAGMAEGERNSTVEKHGHLVCPADKTGKNRYEIVCKVCGDIQGYCWASDTSLNDWVDFHYVSWTDGEIWRGCLTPNISPVDGHLGLECVCGNDTRDFRANMNLPAIRALAIEQENRKGREFNKGNSKFLVKKVNDKK